jgi:hypothetical protein
MVVLEIAGTMAEAEYSNYCPNQILAGEESQRRMGEATFYYRFLSSAYKRSSSRTQLLEETHVVVSYFFFTICGCIQDTMHARYALYHLNHKASPEHTF